ncbi:MAG: glycerol-3-phosphate acyltransferase [Ignavibacteria bacterium]|nr:glycerol-3-phosphate acyltransferase [Ignavibacteria bacterium]
MSMTLLIAGLIGYGIGCIPSAWLLTKIFFGADITREGSGNMGTRNVFDVTGSRWMTLFTLLIDVSKGVTAVMLSQWMYGGWFAATAWACIGVVAGHNFNAFLRFKGGRGLAPAMGLMIAVNPVAWILWVIMFLTGYFVIRKNVHVGSMSGTIGSVVLTYSIPNDVLAQTMMVKCYDISDFKLMVFFVGLLIFMKHVEPIRALIRLESAKDYSDGGPEDNPG